MPSNEYRSNAENSEKSSNTGEIIEHLLWFRSAFGMYRNLFFIIFILFTIAAFSIYMLADPKYTASAVVGPPSPSPATAMMNYMGGGAGVGGIAKKLLGGAGGSGGNDPFQEFQQLLQSPRLAVELAERDHLLPVIFYRRWDAEHNRWKSPSIIHEVVAAIQRALNRPVTDYPDVDQLTKYLDRNLSISQTPNAASTIASLGSGYMTVTFEFRGREETQKLLSVILNRADEIIRQEQLRDVKARISYLKSELNNVTQSDQRDSLIQTLTGQEEIETMLVADQRYATTLVSPPYAPKKPSFPPSPLLGALYVLLLSVTMWAILVWFEPRSARVHALLTWSKFGRGGKRHAHYEEAAVDV